ncbi:DUF4347 domain-containing protein [Allocoleopsis franciscana]|uniref:DUF4347 domain-containing protein n=1 Tax=Allocoleopsis franciscana PCC 7113 TaxID=1173027 RepID=K9WFU3_9CYAN|nr:DUF4347 domain-containing protein [Allocoleopsis franciscana]AFZ19290.1 hypothetical protein Mic7113_3566 [Allocoleopsis franciscana PCC 7113]
MLLSQIQLEKTHNSSHERQDNSLTKQNLIPNTIVFIDAAVDDAQILADGVIPGAEIIFLDPNQDGVEQITEALKERTAVSSVHIVSHGAPGCLSLGSTQLCLDTLERYVSDLQLWSNLFSHQSSQHKSSDLLLYGCNVAAGEVGIAFVQQLHQATGANIAASGDRTGNSALGGTWELEYRVGKVEAPLAFQPWVMQAYPSAFPLALYNGTLGTLPQEQGFLAFADLLPNTAAQTLVAGGVTLNTAPQAAFGRRYAGYSNYSTAGTPANATFPILDRTTGFSISFNVAITEENSVSPDRAGFSFIAISNDLQGIEFGFNNNLIFAQQDNLLFTRGENIAFNTTQATNYTVRVLGNNYTLLANGTQILTGELRNYTAFNPATSQPPLPIDPYELPNYLFFGDSTDQAEAITTISSIAVNRTPNNSTNDTYTIEANTPLNVPINLGVLANDTDPEQDPLNSFLVAGPANGTLTLNPNGSFNYTANPGFIGTDSFTYQINDGDLTNPNAATVSIAVTPTPTPTPVPTPTPTPVPTPTPTDTALTLGLNPNNIFVIEGSSGQTQLKYSLVQGSSAAVNEVGVVVLDNDAGTINGVAPGEAGYVQAALSQGTVIFSALSNPPNGFGVSNQTRNLSVDANDRLLFYIVQNSTTDTALADLAAGRTPPNIFFASSSFNTGGIDSLQVSNPGNGVFTLRWEDKLGGGDQDFNDLVMTIQPTTEPLKVGVTLQGESQHEVIDLRNQTAGLQAQFVVNREAAFDNFVGFYRVLDVNGGIDTDGNGTADVRPGETGYAQAAIQQRVQNLDLTCANQSTATFTAQLEGGLIYVPFLIANGKPDALLDGNSSNDPAVYFPFLGANGDGVDHIRLLGDNTFGFEDLSGGGDRDYNDVIVRVNFA